MIYLFYFHFFPSQRPNRVVFGSTVFEPTGYLAYSPAGQVEVRCHHLHDLVAKALVVNQCLTSGMCDLCRGD